EDDPAARVNAWTTLGGVALVSRDFDRAADLFNQALELAQREDLRWWIGASLNNLSFLAYRRDDLERAGRFSDEAVARWRAIGDAYGLASSLLNLGAIRFSQGDTSAALSHCLESLRLVQQLGSTSLTAELLEDLAGVLHARGRPEVAARLFGSAVAYRTA